MSSAVMYCDIFISAEILTYFINVLIIMLSIGRAAKRYGIFPADKLSASLGAFRTLLSVILCYISSVHYFIFILLVHILTTPLVRYHASSHYL